MKLPALSQPSASLPFSSIHVSDDAVAPEIFQINHEKHYKTRCHLLKDRFNLLYHLIVSLKRFKTVHMHMSSSSYIQYIYISHVSSISVFGSDSTKSAINLQLVLKKKKSMFQQKSSCCLALCLQSPGREKQGGCKASQRLEHTSG